MTAEIGSMAYGRAQLLNNQYLDILPTTAGEEWTIHNINIPFGYACEIYQTDGTNPILDMHTTNSLHSYSYHCNTSSYYTIKNVSGYTIYVSYDGIITAV